MKRFVLLALVAGCKSAARGSDAGPPAEIALTSQLPAPTNPAPEFKVDQDVVFVRDDGAFEIDGYVLESGGPLAFVDPKTTNAPGDRLAPKGWQPAPDGGTKRGYKLRSGSGRFAKTEWVPAERVFPAPWLAAPKVGDVFYERRFGAFTPAKCVVAEAPSSPRAGASATCDGETRPRSVARKDMVAVFRDAKPGELKPGDVVYYRKMYWALVVGTEDDRVVIREAGFSTRDKAVLLSTVQVVH